MKDRKFRPPRWLAYMLATIAVIALGWLVLRPAPVLVDFGMVEQGPLSVTIDDEGQTRVREVYTVSAPVAGELARIALEVGDAVVTEETVIARIRPSDPAFLDMRSQSEAEADVEAAKAELVRSESEADRARAELEFAESEYIRIRQLVERGTSSPAALDRARLALNSAKANLRTAQAAVNVARGGLQRAQARLIEPSERVAGADMCCVVDVRAPVSGTVLRLFQESKAVVAAGAPLVDVGNPSDLEIVVDLLSSDAVKVSPGANVRIDQWGGGRVLNGRVVRIEPFGFTKISALGVEEQRVNVIIELTDRPETWRELGHGYRVEARIVEWQADQTVTVPSSAIFRHRGDWWAFRVADGRAVMTAVRIGRNNGRLAQVLDGLEPGDRVVLHPGESVSDGVRVEARPQ